MKYFMKLLMVFVLTLTCSNMVQAQELIQQQEQIHIKTFWVCMQMGFVDGERILFLSNIQENHWRDYAHRELEFSKAVQKSINNKLQGEYSPYCLDFPSKSLATKANKQLLSKAMKHGFLPIYIKFMYDGDFDVQKKNEE